MTLYAYRAFGKQGNVERGVLEASSLGDLRLQLHELGYSLLGVSPHVRKRTFFSLFKKSIPLRDLQDLWLHLQQLVTAGIPLKESLDELESLYGHKVLGTILREVSKDIQSGILFSAALAQHPYVFNEVVVNLIRAGEKTNNIASALSYLTDYLKWKEEIHKKLLKSLRYPLISMVFMILTISILMALLVPELTSFFRIFNKELPYATRLLIWISYLLSSYWKYYLIIFSSLSIFWISFFKKHAVGKKLASTIKDSIPFISPLRNKLGVAHFFYVFSVLWDNGIDVLQALEIARASSDSPKLKSSLGSIGTAVQEGHSLSQAFQKSGYFPPLIIRMLKIGEKASSLHVNLVTAKNYFDASLKRDTDHLIGLTEPLGIIIIGGIMGWIIGGIFLPLYEALLFVEC